MILLNHCCRTCVRLFVVTVITLLLGSCGTRDINGSVYTTQEPAFDITAFFDGEVRAWGIVQDRSGNLTQQFTVVIDGNWDGTTLTLDETFNYGLGDGPEERVWKLSRDEEGQWRGSAGDILDEATGRSFGNAFRWQYRIDLPVDDTSYVVNFDDWIWAFDDNTIINRSYITKFGITFAEVTIFMQRQS